MKKSKNIKELELLAASQWGMFTVAQAQSLGVRRNQISRMVDALRVEPMCHGVYRFIAGAEPAQVDIKAAWLSVFPKEVAAQRLTARPFDAVLAGRSAACSLGAGDFHVVPYTFIVKLRRQTSREDIRFLQCKLDEADVVISDGIPATSFERTVYDLLRLEEDPDLVDNFMRDAARKHGYAFDKQRLSVLLSPLSARYGFASGDGQSFAAELIARNTAGTQIKKASDSINKALASLGDQEALASARERLDEISKTLAKSQTFGSYSELAASVQEALARDSAYTELQEKLRGMPILNLDRYPGLANALEGIPRFEASQIYNCERAFKGIVAAAIADSQDEDPRAFPKEDVDE